MKKTTLPKKQTGGISPKKSLSKALKPSAGESGKLNMWPLALDQFPADKAAKSGKYTTASSTGSKGKKMKPDYPMDATNKVKLHVSGRHLGQKKSGGSTKKK